MSYRNPTKHELKLSSVLEKVYEKSLKLLNKKSKGECLMFMWCSSAESQRNDTDNMQDAPVANYISNMDRETATITMLELIHKWQHNGELKPIHELKDADGKYLSDILNENLN